MIELENDNLGEILAANAKTFVMFGASWCGACKMSKPKVKRLAQSGDVPVYYVDAEHMVESRALTGGLDNLPTFVAFEGTNVTMKEAGTKSIEKVYESLK